MTNDTASRTSAAQATIGEYGQNSVYQFHVSCASDLDGLPRLELDSKRILSLTGSKDGLFYRFSVMSAQSQRGPVPVLIGWKITESTQDPYWPTMGASEITAIPGETNATQLTSTHPPVGQVTKITLTNQPPTLREGFTGMVLGEQPFLPGTSKTGYGYLVLHTNSAAEVEHKTGKGIEAWVSRLKGGRRQASRSGNVKEKETVHSESDDAGSEEDLIIYKKDHEAPGDLDPEKLGHGLEETRPASDCSRRGSIKHRRASRDSDGYEPAVDANLEDGDTERKIQYSSDYE